MIKISPPRNHVHFNLQTGELVGRSNSTPPMEREGCGVLFLDDSPFPDFDSHKVNVATGRIIKRAAAEINAAIAPKPFEVVAVIATELSNTDQFMMADRPMADEKRAAWAEYRQALRDLSKLKTAGDQIKSWPLRPDGVDAAAFLKSRAKAKPNG